MSFSLSSVIMPWSKVATKIETFLSIPLCVDEGTIAAMVNLLEKFPDHNKTGDASGNQSQLMTQPRFRLEAFPPTHAAKNLQFLDVLRFLLEALCKLMFGVLAAAAASHSALKHGQKTGYFTSSDPHRDIILLHICHKF